MASKLFSVIIAAVVTVATGGFAAGSFMAGLAGSMATSLGISATMASFLIRAGIGLALSALAPKPSAPSRGYTVTQRGTALDHQIIYGKTKTAGAVVFDATNGSSNKYLHRVLAFAGHEINSYEEIWLNDYKLTLNSNGEVTSATNDGGATTTTRYNGYVRIKKHLGADDQTHDTTLAAETFDNDNWTSAHRLRGIAYLYVRLKFSADVFPNGIPEIQAVIKGKKVYDPRNATTAWSDNPALCIRDYLVSDYGLGENTSYIDDMTVITAANACDRTASNNDTWFTMNGAFLTSAQPADILNDMLTSMAGVLWYAQGNWRMRAAKWETPTLTLDEDDLRGPINVGTRHSRRDNFNIIKGTWRGADSDWQTTDYPEYKVAQAITDDGGLESTLDLPLLFTDNSDEAQRIARIVYERNRQQLTISAQFGLRAMACQVGDFIQLDNDRMGWTNKYWEVVEWSFGMNGLDLVVNMVLREISSSVFDEISDYVAYEKDNTSIVSPFDSQDVTFATPPVVKSSSLNGDGTVVPKMKWTWNVDDESDVDYYIFGWRTTSSGDYTEVVLKDRTFEIEPAIAGATYYVRVRAVNHQGVAGTPTTRQDAATGDSTAPATPTLNTPIGGYQAITLTWAAPSEADFRHMEIQRSNTSGGTYSTIGYSSSTSFVDGDVGNEVTRYYKIRAIDFSGNASSYTSAKSATTIAEVTGPSGYTQAQVFLYAAGTTAPSDPTGTFTYTFSTGALSGGTLGSWSTDVPTLTNGQYLWVKTASAYANTTTDSIPASEFSSAVKTSYAGTNGTNGTTGYNSATVTLFKKTSSTTTPAKPTTSETYTFATASLTATNNGWSQSAPSLSSGEYLWSISAVAYSNTATDTIASNEWSTPSIVGVAGSTGPTGARGAGQWIINLDTADMPAENASSSTINTKFTDTTDGVGVSPVDGDQAWFTDNDTFEQRVWIYDGTNWNYQNVAIDGNLVVSGSITSDKIDVDNLSAISATLGDVTIEDTLRLEAGGAGFIGGRSSNSAYAEDGFYLARTDKGGGNKGYELSATSVYSDGGTNRISGIIAKDEQQVSLFNPLIYSGGTTSGGTSSILSSDNNHYANLGNTDSVTVTVYGGGGAGGYGLGDGGASGRNNSGGTTRVTIRRGSTTGTVLATIDAAGGLGGTNANGVGTGSGGNGQASDFGSGGSGGSRNSNGSSAPSTSYGAGGGGGGGDKSSWFDSSGQAGGGGLAGQVVTQTIDLSSETVDTYIKVEYFGAGGVSTGGDTSGGNGAYGAMKYSSILGGTTQYQIGDLAASSVSNSYGPWYNSGSASGAMGNVVNNMSGLDSHVMVRYDAMTTATKVSENTLNIYSFRKIYKVI